MRIRTKPPSYHSFKLIGLLLLFGVFFTQASWGQLKRANDYFEQFRYSDAIPLYQKVLSKSPDNLEALLKIADAYRKVNDYANAELYYARSIQFNDLPSEVWLYYGQSLRANGKLAAAKEQFQKYSDLNQDSFIARLLVQSIEDVSAWENAFKGFKVDTLKGLNSSYSDFAMVPFKDQLYFTTDRDKHFYSPEEFGWKGRPYLSIYETSEKADNPTHFKAPKSVKGAINSAYHDGPVSFNATFDRIFITRVGNEIREKGFINRMKIYTASLQKGKWKDFEEMVFNSDSFSVGHPHLSGNGLQLYFISDMPGGMGGMDIYVSNWNKETASWGPPLNLGAEVNTAGNEVFPHFKDNRLYFASDGHAGYGGLDLFVAIKTNQWLRPVNLKQPINSTTDDFGIYFLTDSTGYFSSNREGGKGDDDLYAFSVLDSASNKNVPISGLFEYNGLPAIGKKVVAMDENDSIVGIAYTDSLGRFKFVNLQSDETYLLRVEEEDGDLITDGRLFLTDTQGEKVQLVERLKDGTFAFTALPLEKYENNETLLEEDSPVVENLMIFGQLFDQLPGDYTEGMEVLLVDEEGNIIATAMSDEQGRFVFRELPSDQTYLLRLKEENPDIQILILNEEERPQYLAMKSEKGDYRFMKSLDASKFPSYAANRGQTSFIGRYEYQGNPVANTKIVIYLEDGTLVQTSYTNEDGEFQFNSLALDKNYFFDAPAAEDDIRFGGDIYVLNSSGSKLYLIDRLKDGKFAFQALPFDEYNEVDLLTEEDSPDFISIAGQVYKKLPGDMREGMEVYVLDESGTIIDTVLTDKEGNFIFSKLDPDEKYSFQLQDAADDEVQLLLVDQDGRVLERTVKNEQGEFTYRRLTYEVASLPESDLEATDDLIDEPFNVITGQLFKKLPGDFEEGMTINIYNEEGELVGTTTTDASGKFVFSKLDPDQQYTFALAEEGAEDLELALLNDKGGIAERTVKNDKGQFTYKRLTSDLLSLAEQEETDELLDDSFMSINGQVYKKLPGDFKKKMEVYIYDEDGELIATTFTDKSGHFAFTKLDPDKKYLFKVEDEEPNFHLLTLDEDNNVIEKIIKNEKGEFRYSKLTFEKSVVAMVEAHDDQVVATFERAIKLKDYTIYFGFDERRINGEAARTLDRLIAVLQKNKAMKLEVSSHTDVRGDNNYNLLLSKWRTEAAIKYLTNKGIAKDRLIGRYFGEQRLAVDCANPADCPNEKHAKNRRTEFKRIE